MVIARRQFLGLLGGLGLATLPRAALSDARGAAVGATEVDVCGTGSRGTDLFVPGSDGFLGRLTPGDDLLKLDAVAVTPASANAATGFTLGYVATHRGRSYRNPTLQLAQGQRLRVAFTNRTSEPTIIHWHGLAVDTRNDGGGMPVVAPGERYDYAFEVRDRGALYWYHPHPHGLTARQAYRGLFGMIEVDDADQRRLRDALALVPGKSEIELVLQDRRGRAYAATAADRLHGFLGDTVLVNGSACPHLDVATRIYRFRILNASNARTYLLALRTADGKALPLVLIGSDAGLLATPQRCEQAYIAAAERLDVLVDLSDAAVGESIVLETRAFDPMHMEMPNSAAAPAVDHAAMDHAPPSPALATTMDRAAMGHGGSFPEGARRALLQLRVRERVAIGAKIPHALSSLAAIDIRAASERPLRLGFAKGRWRINDRVFVMGETPIEVARDSTEIWLLRNYFTSMPHAMHIHGFHFQVLERQTSPEQIAALKIDASGRLATDLGWKDTVLVWPGESVKVAIAFAMPFAGAQTYMVHCHNLEHEDGGMMLGMKVG
ncbi:MAG: multicopper oxidase domain-containing protein [Casimicrobiaceae bacterium]